MLGEYVVSNYRNSNLLYKASLSVWTARKKDKGESLKVNTAAGAVDGAANVHKQLLPDSPELLAVQKWATGFRTWIYDTTLPWDDSGWRIGRTIRHMDFMAEAGDRTRVGEALVNDFIDTYQRAVEEAKFKLNGMFNQSDYPSADEVRRKFCFSVDCMTMPTSEDFRVVDGVEQAEVDRLVEVAKTDTEQRIGAAMKEAYSRLYDVVSKMAITLTQYGNKDIKKFNNTLIGNITTLAAIMPALNLTDDPALAELTRQAERLASYDLMDLRENETTRNAAIREASSLAKQFAGMVPEVAIPTAKPDVIAEITAVVEAEPIEVAARLIAAPASEVALLAGGWGD